MVQQG
jgi:hypothetical protein